MIVNVRAEDLLFTPELYVQLNLHLYVFILSIRSVTTCRGAKATCMP